MKIKNSIVLAAVLATSIVFAIPSMASECINNGPDGSASLTNDSISVKARIRKSFGSFPVYTNQEYVFGCSLTAKMLLNYTIPDDSPISSLDMYVYINGRQLIPRKRTRGSSFTFKFSPDKVQDFRIELKNLQSSTGVGYIYNLNLPEHAQWLNIP